MHRDEPMHDRCTARCPTDAHALETTKAPHPWDPRLKLFTPCQSPLASNRGLTVARPLVAIGMPATTRFKPLSATDSNCYGGRIPIA